MRRLFVTCTVLASVLGLGGRAMAGRAAGWLDVASDPPAEIFIDGVDTKKTTPQTHLMLEAGHHKLKLVTADGAHERSIGFTVQPGQGTSLTIHLAS